MVVQLDVSGFEEEGADVVTVRAPCPAPYLDLCHLSLFHIRAGRGRENKVDKCSYVGR